MIGSFRPEVFAKASSIAIAYIWRSPADKLSLGISLPKSLSKVTDTEIGKTYLASLDEHISHKIMLDYNGSDGSSNVESGYFGIMSCYFGDHVMLFWDHIMLFLGSCYIMVPKQHDMIPKTT
jgi:hypothetical protein